MWTVVALMVLFLLATLGLIFLGGWIGSRVTSLPLKIVCGVVWIAGILTLNIFPGLLPLPWFFAALAGLTLLCGIFSGIKVR